MLEVIQNLRILLTGRERLQALALFALLVGGAVLEMLGVGAIPAFVALLADPDALTHYTVVQRAIDTVGIQTGEELVLAGAIALLVLFLIKNAYLAALSWLQARYVFNRQIAISKRLFSAYLHSPYPFHLQRNTAELLRNTNQDAMEVVGAGLLPLLTLVMEGLTVTAILLLLLAVEPIISLVAFAILGVTTLLFLRLVRGRVLHYGEQMHLARTQMIQAVNEGLGGIKVTKVFGREEAFVGSFARAGEAYAYAARIRQVAQETPRLLLETMAVAGLLAVAALMFSQERTETELIPILALLAVAVVRMVPSFNRITSSLTLLRFGRFPIAKMAADILELRTAGGGHSVERVAFEKQIRLEGVTYCYPGEAEACLHNISFTIPKGAAVGIVGPTGGGKTTLVDVVVGLLEPTDGRILVDGQDIRGRESAWQHKIGYVPQDIYLADDTIRRNVAFGLADEAIDEEAVCRAMDAAQVREFVERLPNGLNTVVGELGVRLSGGQRQRIGIARALYHDPEVLVLDEATSALDDKTEQYVLDAIEHLRGRRTLLVIAHRASTVEACDCLYRLVSGTLHETSEAVGAAQSRFPAITAETERHDP